MFLAQTRRSHRIACALAELRAWAGLAGVAIAACWIAAPAALVVAIGLIVVVVVSRVVWVATSFGPSVAALDARDGLRGWLCTFVETSRVPDEGARSWLAGELAARIAAIADDRGGSRLLPLLRRPARLVWVALLILLLLRALWLPALPDGILPLAGRPASLGPEQAGPGIGGEPGTQRSPATTTHEESRDATAAGGASDPSTGAVAAGQHPATGAEVRPLPAAPLDLPVADVFAMPALIEDSVSDATSDTARPGRTRAGADSPSSGGEAPPASNDERQFERARESALGNRHVPVEERDAVRRWFDEFARGRR